MLVTVNYELSPEEVARGVTRIIRRRRLFLGCLAPVLAAVGILELQAKQILFGAGALGSGSFLMMVLVVGRFAVSDKQADRLCVPAEATFTEEAFTVQLPLSKSEIRWQMLNKTEETKEFFLLYTGPQRAFIIPKRAFTVEDAVELRVFLEAAPWKRSQ